MIQITPLRQGDPKWADVRIGNSAATVEKFGCTLTSCCMALQKLRGYEASPADAARFWKFNLKGEILWNSTQFKGMTFVWRGYGADVQKVAEYANSEKKAVILEVNYRKHWVYLEKVESGVLYIIDPIDGKRYAGLPKKYKFTGFALFEKDEKTPPDWAAESWKKAQKKIPHLAFRKADEVQTFDDLQQCLVDLKKIKQVSDMPAYRLAVIFDNLGLLD